MQQSRSNSTYSPIIPLNILFVSFCLHMVFHLNHQHYIGHVHRQTSPPFILHVYNNRWIEMVTMFPNDVILEPLYVTPFHSCTLPRHLLILKCWCNVSHVYKLCFQPHVYRESTYQKYTQDGTQYKWIDRCVAHTSKHWMQSLHWGTIVKDKVEIVWPMAEILRPNKVQLWWKPWVTCCFLPHERMQQTCVQLSIIWLQKTTKAGKCLK